MVKTTGLLTGGFCVMGKNTMLLSVSLSLYYFLVMLYDTSCKTINVTGGTKMKKMSFVLSMILIISLLAGCAGTPVVYYTNCTCPVDSHEEAVVDVPATIPSHNEVPAPAEGALKTGLAISASLKKSANASAEAEGKGDYDVTMVAVLVDDEGIIRDCIIDGIASSVAFDASGAITTDLSAGPQTKNELGENYNMVKYGGAIAEWDAQAKALADFAVGKTVEQLRSGAVAESGYAPEGSDLASKATIHLGGYVDTIEKAVSNAKHLGAQTGDVLKMATATKIDSSKAADAENAGNAQLDVDVTALTMNGEIITSCALDSVQAKVAFDASGAITSDVAAPVATKNELGENYNMVKYGGAIAEWDAQAASFAEYVTGKTADEVAGISITEATKPADADLAAKVTISVIGFMNLIVKAAQ